MSLKEHSEYLDSSSKKINDKEPNEHTYVPITWIVNSYLHYDSEPVSRGPKVLIAQR